MDTKCALKLPNGETIQRKAKCALKLPNGETIEREPKCVDTKCALKLPNGVILQPKELVRWLGVWFDSGLTFKQHVAICISQARSAFQRMTRLANTKKGLSPFALRQLYIACITSIADYGSVIWWKGQA